MSEQVYVLLPRRESFKREDPRGRAREGERKRERSSLAPAREGFCMNAWRVVRARNNWVYSHQTVASTASRTDVVCCDVTAAREADAQPHPRNPCTAKGAPPRARDSARVNHQQVTRPGRLMLRDTCVLRLCCMCVTSPCKGELVGEYRNCVSIE
ncbi:hypothetical protein FHG87_012089 [Trinorchestia longiramus]|nr:hypothetical protein FHG87_012089 [Trinorchestia longiramus]